MIRVLHVIGSMNFGGAESMIMNLYRHIDREKVQFDFLVRNKNKSVHDREIESLGGRIFYIDPFRGVNAISYYKQCKAFFEQHREISIIHGHIGSSAALYLKAAKEENRYTIAHSHNANKITNLHNFAYNFFSYPTRFIADEFLACSTEAGISRYGKRVVKRPNYKNFHNAIDLEQYKYLPVARDNVNKELDLKNTDIVIGTIGRITQQKNPQFIFNIFRNAVSKDSRVKCLWVGTGELEEKYKDIINEHKLNERIIMMGVRDDVKRLLQRMDCFIMPSLYEGLPVTAIEAQAAGLECLLADTISKETQVSDLVTWLPLNVGESRWAEEAIRVAQKLGNRRKSPIDSLRLNGYDINSSARWLQNFYVEHSKTTE